MDRVPTQLPVGYPGHLDSWGQAPLTTIYEATAPHYASASPSRRASPGFGADEPPSKRQKGPYSCDACGTHYKEKRALARHKHSQQHHQNVGLAPPEKFPCSICKKSFVRNHDRKRHENEAHKGQKRSIVVKSSPSEESESPPENVSPFQGVKCVEEKSWVVEDNTLNAHDDWDVLPTHMEVHPGPANWTSSYGKDPHMFTLSALTQDDGVWKGSTTGSADTSSLTAATTADRNSQSWLDDGSDSESEAPSTPGRNFLPTRQLSQETNKSRHIDSAVDMSDDEPHEPKIPTITTFDYRKQAADDTASVSSEEDSMSRTTTRESTMLPPSQKKSVIQKYGRSAQAAPESSLMCVLCNEPFPSDELELHHHLRLHLDSMQQGRSPHRCEICDFGFAHPSDLERHKRSAKEEHHCGLPFDHAEPCTGHHPPTITQRGTIVSDRDRSRLCTLLWNWEQAQLRVYIQNIAQLSQLKAKQSDAASVCYSVEAIGGRSRNSISSFAISVNTYGSAPCDYQDGELDIGGLKSRMRKLSLRSSAKKLPSMLRAGGNLNRSLYNAASTNDKKRIEQLVKMGADPAAILGDQSILSVAIQKAEYGTVELLINLGASVHTPERRFGSPLACAAYFGRLNVCELLIAYGASITRSGSKYGCPLGAAAAAGQYEAAEFLISKGADVSQVAGDFHCVLSTAAAYGHAGMCRLLIKHGADVNQPGGSEGSPLGFAVYHDHLNTATALIDIGARVDAVSKAHGNVLCSAITKAAKRGHDTSIIQLLLSRGAHPDQRRSTHNPLRTACAYADVAVMTQVVKMLLDRGADPNITGSKGSALQLAKGCRARWMERKVGETFMTMNQTPQTEIIDDTIGYCYEVIKLLRDAGAHEEERRSGSIGSRNVNMSG